MCNVCNVENTSRAPGSRQNSPTEVDGLSQGGVNVVPVAGSKLNDVVMSQQVPGMAAAAGGIVASSGAALPPASMAGLSLSVPQYEMMHGGYEDPFYAAASNSMLMPPNMDSPNYGAPMDYGQQQVCIVFY